MAPLPNAIVICHTGENSDGFCAGSRIHAVREFVNVLNGKGPTTGGKDRWWLAKAPDEGFGGA